MYKKPNITSYEKKVMLEIIGPAQSASITIETWRGAKLDSKPAAHKMVKLSENHNTATIVKIKEDIC